MNTLLYALLSALRCHRWLRLLACAFIFTSLGNGLTLVLVFGLLLEWQAPPSLLTLAWLFATLPGYVGSLLGEKLCTRFAPIRILIFTELLGLLALLFPLLGMHYHSITALLAVQSCEALLSGMSWPALTLLFKRGLPEPELPAATCLEHVIFASQVLLGTGLGVLLFQHVPMAVLLATDALSFGGSLLLLYQTGRAFSGKPAPSEPDTPQAVTVSWRSLTLRQKRSLLLLPALAAVGAPAMALLPALAQQIQPADAAGMALPLLFARSLGQLCGPLLINKESLPRYAGQNRPLLLCLGLFFVAYAFIPALPGKQAIALGLIFIAHLASNIIFAAGTFGVLSSFAATHISAASGKAWRWQTVSASVFTSIAALIAATHGAIQAFYLVSASALLLVAAVMIRYRE